MKKTCLVILFAVLLASVEARRGGGRGGRGGRATGGYECDDATVYNCPSETEWDADKCKCVCKDEPSTACADGEFWDTFSCGCSTCALECPGQSFVDELNCKCVCHLRCSWTEKVDYETCECVDKCEGVTCTDPEVLDEQSCTCYDASCPHLNCPVDTVVHDEECVCVCPEPEDTPCEEGTTWSYKTCTCE